MCLVTPIMTEQIYIKWRCCLRYFQKLKVFEHVIVDVEFVTVMNIVGEKK